MACVNSLGVQGEGRNPVEPLNPAVESNISIESPYKFNTEFPITSTVLSENIFVRFFPSTSTLFPFTLTAVFPSILTTPFFSPLPVAIHKY